MNLKAIEVLSDAAIDSAIEACHPEVDGAGTQELRADALAMRLVHPRYSKRELVDLVRWLLLGGAEAEPITQLTLEEAYAVIGNCSGCAVDDAAGALCYPSLRDLADATDPYFAYVQWSVDGDDFAVYLPKASNVTVVVQGNRLTFKDSDGDDFAVELLGPLDIAQALAAPQQELRIPPP